MAWPEYMLPFRRPRLQERNDDSLNEIVVVFLLYQVRRYIFERVFSQWIALVALVFPLLPADAVRNTVDRRRPQLLLKLLIGNGKDNH